MNELSDKVLEILQRTSEDSPVSRVGLIFELGIDETPANERMVRRIITDELMKKYPIGSNSNGSSSGYYMIKSRKGLEKANAEDVSRLHATSEKIRTRIESFENQNREYKQDELF
jgi:hypothetical protein